MVMTHMVPSVNQMLAARAAYSVVAPVAAPVIRRAGRSMKRSLRGKADRSYKKARAYMRQTATTVPQNFFGELLENNFRIDDTITLIQNDWTVAVVPWRNAAAVTGAGASRLVLSSIVQGNAKNERTGRQVNIKKVQFRLGFYLKSTALIANGDQLHDVPVRVILVVWESTNGASIDARADNVLDVQFVNDVEGMPSIKYFRNTDQTQNYRVLYDKTKTIKIEPGRQTWDTTDSTVEDLRPTGKEIWFEKNINVPDAVQNIRYSDNGQTISSQVSRSICMYYYIDTSLIVNSGGVNTVTVGSRGGARIRYTA